MKVTIQEPKDALQDVAFETRGTYLLGFHLLGRDSIFSTMILVFQVFINVTISCFFNFVMHLNEKNARIKNGLKIGNRNH